MRAAAALVVLAGCGRFGFAGLGDAISPGSDGPARDAPAGDTTSDVPVDAFDQAAACAGFQVCDSFEGANFSPTWTVGLRVTLDATHVHRGRQAVHVHNPAFTAGTGGYSQLGETATFSGAIVPPTFYVRAWLYLASLPEGANHLELISIEGAMSSSLGDYTFAYSNNTALYTQEDQTAQLVGVPPPTNQWFCVVMRVTRDTTGAGSLGLTSDVLPATTLANVITEQTVNPLHDVWLGLGFAGSNVVIAQPAMDMWIDDVIVDPNPPTCAD